MQTQITMHSYSWPSYITHGKRRTMEVIFSKLCVVLSERQTVKFLQRNNIY